MLHIARHGCFSTQDTEGCNTQEKNVKNGYPMRSRVWPVAWTILSLLRLGVVALDQAPLACVMFSCWYLHPGAGTWSPLPPLVRQIVAWYRLYGSSLIASLILYEVHSTTRTKSGYQEERWVSPHMWICGFVPFLGLGVHRDSRGYVWAATQT